MPLLPAVDSLQRLFFYIFVITAVIVFGTLLFSLLRFKHKIHQNLGIEMVWTLIPFIILIALALPAMRVLYAT